VTWREGTPYLLGVDKPSGITSFDVIRELKRKLPRKTKIGHFGTLDPFATGVMLVGIGACNRLVEYSHRLPKTYSAGGILGIKTPTGDCDHHQKTLDPNWNSIQSTFDAKIWFDLCQQRLQGEYWQAPHAYSAAKFEGRPLHAYAREGVSLERPKKLRKLYALELEKIDASAIEFRAVVSSGTYIRVLFEDMAQLAGTYGYLQALRRESIGPIDARRCLSLEWYNQHSLDEWAEKELNLRDLLDFEEVPLDEDHRARFRHGATIVIPEQNIPLPRTCWVVGENGQLLGLGERQYDKVSPKIVF
jgi:tRNA pseudouridine55 synthase